MEGNADGKKRFHFESTLKKKAATMSTAVVNRGKRDVNNEILVVLT
jgi:hypothetical protein